MDYNFKSGGPSLVKLISDKELCTNCATQVMDCVGPNSDASAQVFEVGIEEFNGNYELSTIPANKTLCALSSINGIQSEYCGVARDGVFQKITRGKDTCTSSLCSIQGLTAAECPNYYSCQGPNGYCHDTRINSQTGCQGSTKIGKWVWDTVTKRCISKLVGADKCTGVGMVNMCNGGFCNDFEYSNGASYCISIRTDWSDSCPFKHAKTGQCIVPVTSAECATLENHEWRSEATDSASCLRKGATCTLDSKGWTLFGKSKDECSQCGGLPKTVGYYKWTNDTWVQGQPNPLIWTTPSYSLPNYWGNYMSVSTVTNILTQAAIRSTARQMTNKHRGIFQVYLQVFKKLSCDCVTKSTSCWIEPAEAVVADCAIGSNFVGRCKGLTFPKGVFASGQTANVTAKFHSASNYLATTNNTATVTTLTKRCNPIEIYETVLSPTGKTLTGQIVGDGISYEFSIPPLSPYELCLYIDTTIQLNTVSYSSYGIAYV